MKRNSSTTIACMLLGAVLSACGGPGANQSSQAKGKTSAGPVPSVIPAPRDYTRGSGYYRVGAANDVIYSGGAGAKQAADFFVEHLAANPGIVLRPAFEKDSKHSSISFQLSPSDQSFEPEGY